MNTKQLKILMLIWLYIGSGLMWFFGAGFSVAIPWYGINYIIPTITDIALSNPSPEFSWINYLAIPIAVVTGCWVGLSGIWKTTVITLREFKRHKADLLRAFA